MMDKAITEFLENKKQDYLKKKVKANTSEEDKYVFNQEAQEKYGLANWIMDASKRAKQLSLSSHPAKFVHPDAKTSSIIAKAKQENDGLLRSGNVDVELDVFGNAAALDVEKFLRTPLQDNKTVLQHLEENSETIQQQFTINSAPFEAIRAGFLQIKRSNVDQTSEKLKQVYFPVDRDYHLLSILIPSGIIYKLKEKINNVRFSKENEFIYEELKKDKPNQLNGIITNIHDLTAIGYGGTNPRNISVLNMKNTKKVGTTDSAHSYYLLSIPPTLEKRSTQPPKQDFFANCLWPDLFKTDFKEFHTILSWRKNNLEIRDKRDDVVLNAMTKVTRLVERIREINSGWSGSDTYAGLPVWQKIWLDNHYAVIRHDDKQNHQYLKQAQSYFANWFINYYKESTKDNKLLGDDDIAHIKDILNQEQELLQ